MTEKTKTDEVPCRDCGNPLIEIPWNRELHLLLCDTTGCQMLSRPQVKRYIIGKNDKGENVFGPPRPSKGLEESGNLLIYRKDQYSWSTVKHSPDWVAV